MKLTVIRATQTASFLLFACFANSLMAETRTDYSSGLYMGGNIGISNANIDKDKITQNITNYSYSEHENDMGFKLFGGYQFNKYFAIEGGYFDLGKFDYTLSTPTGALDADLKVRGLNLDAVAILPFTEDFSAFARVGANYAYTESSFNPRGTISVNQTNPKEDALNYKFGAGLEYAITDAISLRLEAERYRINDTLENNGDIDLYSFGLVYKFGRTKEVAVVEKQKEEVVPEVDEEPIVVTATDAEQKIKEKITQNKVVVLLFEEVHFEFDKSTLSKEAKSALKKDLTQLKDNQKIKMLVTGHTSKIGTQKYNQALSERRAQAVKEYLVEEKLISAEKIAVIGYGGTRPAKYEANPSDINSKAAKANMRVILEIFHK